MKKTIFGKILLAGALALGLTSCEDRDIVSVEANDAPIVMDLSSDKITLDSNFPDNNALTVTWSQATYSVPVEVNYSVEISATESFETFKQLTTTTQSANYAAFSVLDLNEAVKTVGLVPDEWQDLYIRVTSYLGSSLMRSISNVTKVQIKPYLASPTYEYVDYYLIGSATAGAWDNAANNANLYPLLKTAQSGIYTFTGYFAEGEFKMIKVKGSWDEQLGLGSSAGQLSTDGGSGNIPVPAAGYYKLTVDANNLSYTLEAAEASSTTYSSISIIGSVIGNWDVDTQLTQSTFDPHVWYISGVELSAGEFKFRADNEWTVSWGTNAEFFGTAAQGGANIPVTSPWTYDVYFNDSTGQYSVIPN